jgi:hypothetical protein
VETDYSPAAMKEPRTVSFTPGDRSLLATKVLNPLHNDAGLIAATRVLSSSLGGVVSTPGLLGVIPGGRHGGVAGADGSVVKDGLCDVGVLLLRSRHG